MAGRITRMQKEIGDLQEKLRKNNERIRELEAESMSLKEQIAYLKAQEKKE